MSMGAETALHRMDEDQWNLLENYDMLINVIDLNNYEIVRANNYSKNILGDVTGKTCWKAFHAAQKGPCPFCPKRKLLDKDQNPQGTWKWEMRSNRTGCWYEMIDKAFYWGDDRRLVKLQIAWDITKQKLAEEALRRCNSELESCVITCTSKIDEISESLNRKVEEHRKAMLQQDQLATEIGTLDIAFKVMLDKTRQQEIELEEKIVANIKYLIFPQLDDLRKYLHEKEGTVCLGQLQEKLKNLTSSFSKKMSSGLLNLTPREIQVADLIREGRTTKEIAVMLNLSVSTVECFRDNIREKLGIKNKKVNLRSFLISNIQERPHNRR